MKVVISIPTKMYQRAERLAKRMKRSRSELYQLALTEYISRHDQSHITKSLDNTLTSIGKLPTDPFVSAAAHRILKRVEW